MPNWIEGSLKVRGKTQNLINFIENVIDNFSKLKYNNDIEYSFEKWTYIKNSRRAFINDCVIYINSNKENQTIVLPIKQAWSFIASDGEEKRWVALANDYKVDIRLQGFECGLEFYQDFAIVNGEIIIDEVKQYENWDWECPMPRLGG